MSRDTAEAAVRFGFDQSRSGVDFTFFGGEPLLEKELLLETVDYARKFQQTTGSSHTVRFFTTTNGLLLDEPFLTAARARDLHITLSLDGHQAGHDLTRRLPEGQGSFQKIAENFPAILTHLPGIEILMTFTPANIRYLADGIRSLYAEGFRVFNLGANYEEPWSSAALSLLESELQRLGDFYLECFRREQQVYISSFDGKIATHTHPRGSVCACCDKNDGEIAVAPSGNIYPCLRFVKTDQDPTLLLGNVHTGMDRKKRAKLLAEAGKEWDECRTCGNLGRCFHYCSAVNFKVTGSFHQPPPVLCRLESLTIRMADHLAETLYQEQNPMFLRRFYNR